MLAKKNKEKVSKDEFLFWFKSILNLLKSSRGDDLLLHQLIITDVLGKDYIGIELSYTNKGTEGYSNYYFRKSDYSFINKKVEGVDLLLNVDKISKVLEDICLMLGNVYKGKLIHSVSLNCEGNINIKCLIESDSFKCCSELLKYKNTEEYSLLFNCVSLK